MFAKRRIAVVGAVIVREGRILCAQRGPDGTLPGLWEFPGGKIEPRELPEAALVREIREELDCSIEVGRKIALTEHEYDFGFVVLTTFYAQIVDGEPTISEHANIEWLAPADLTSLRWAPADIPTVEIIGRDFA